MDPHHDLVASASSAEVSDALARCDSPPLVIWDSKGVILLANQGAAAVLGVALSDLVGTHISKYADPPEVADRVVSEVAKGTFDAYRATRRIRTGHHRDVQALIWTQAIEVDGQRGGVSVVVDKAELGRLGRDPKKTRLDLLPTALGAVDTRWNILVLSAEIEELVHRTPAECVGTSLLDLVHVDDVPRLRGTDGRPPAVPVSLPRMRLSDKAGGWIESCVLLSPKPEDPTESLFALIGFNRELLESPWDRIAELELVLRRIGAEVRAAGALEAIGALPPSPLIPQLSELTSRQWEVLSRLLQGERVPTIARGLFLSESTVRNHLATIFRKFGVHTQSELLELLRSKAVTAQ